MERAREQMVGGLGRAPSGSRARLDRRVKGKLLPTALYIDADACPVKEEAVRVAERHGLTIHFVSNAFMRLPEGPLIKRVVVSDGPDAADDWIAERAGKRDIVVTADIPLAARCLKAGARVVGPTGKPFTETSIGMALAMRDLSQHLRETGESRGFNASFTPRDRSRFLEELDRMLRRAVKEGPQGP
jgi:uncharacterized protein YaiI (UPF0178 family)